MEATKQYFLVVLFIMLYKSGLAAESVEEILVCYHSSESSEILLSSDAVVFDNILFPKPKFLSFINF